MSALHTWQFFKDHPLTRRSRLRSFVRYAKWQLGSRLVGGAVVHDWVAGARFLVRAGETGLTGNIYAGLHEFDDMGFLLHVMRDADLFLDIGANVGSYSILASATSGARGYAFEPGPSAYARMVENIRLNHAETRFKCLNIGLGNADGAVRFTTALDTTNHVVASGEMADSAVDVRVARLDDIVAAEQPTIAKIDVEGYETPVLEGADQTLRKTSLHSVIMELNGDCARYGFDESKILTVMSGYGFRTFSYDPIRRHLTDLSGKNLRSGNTLFIRDIDLVRERIASAKRISLLGVEF